MMKSATAPGSKRDYLIPVLLILLALVPVAAGSVRLAELASGPEVTQDNARFLASPLPVVLHVLSVSVYAMLGAFQFSPSLRKRRPRFHRSAGRILIPSGILTAVTGLWMQTFYELPAYDGELLAVFRYFFGSAMLVSIGLGVAALLRRDFARHGAWMLRAYAIGMGAGTQVLTHVPWLLIWGEPEELPRAVLMGAGWIINLLVAEWILMKRSIRQNPRAASARLAPFTSFRY
jgi:uncharacterized membrane protein